MRNDRAYPAAALWGLPSTNAQWALGVSARPLRGSSRHGAGANRPQ